MFLIMLWLGGSLALAGILDWFWSYLAEPFRRFRTRIKVRFPAWCDRHDIEFGSK